jgi:hypothetical protein
MILNENTGFAPCAIYAALSGLFLASTSQLSTSQLSTPQLSTFMVRFFLLFFLLPLLWSCSDRRNIRDYYFPVSDLKDGKVYAFVSTGADTTEREYWYYKSFVRDSGIFLTITKYNSQFLIEQIIREKIVDNGVLARDYFLYQPDTSSGTMRQIVANLEANNTFPFSVSDSMGVFLFSLNFKPLEDSSSTIYLIRNRRYMGDGPDFVFQGKQYPTVKIGMEELVGNEKEGASEIEGEGEEVFAKGLGLVSYHRSFAEGKIQYSFRLEEIFGMEELEKRARRTLEETGGE